MSAGSQTTSTPIEKLEQILVQKLERGQLELPLLPQVASQVMALAADPAAAAAKLSSLIHQDQALAAHVLRIANSPAYMPRSPVVSLQHAVAMLGINLLSEIAFTASLKAGAFQVPGHEEEVKQLWRHSLASGAFAKEAARTRTVVPHIYAVGDMVGAPALASKAMEQGRRAVRHALNLPVGDAASTIPPGIYTIPEIASIGLDEQAARERYREPLIGRARFEEVARAQISGTGQGLLKMVADSSGERLLGVQIVGDSATELVHVGQLALQQAAPIESFIDNVFNFPTYAEAYRVAALDILGRIAKRRTGAEAA